MADKYVSLTRAIAWVLWRDETVLDDNLHPLERLLAWPLYPPQNMTLTKENSNDLLGRLRIGSIRAIGRLNGYGPLSEISEEQWGVLSFVKHPSTSGSSSNNHPDTVIYDGDNLTFWTDVRVSLADLQICFKAEVMNSLKTKYQVESMMRELLETQKPERKHGYKKALIDKLASQTGHPFNTIKLYSSPAFAAYENEYGKKT